MSPGTTAGIGIGALALPAVLFTGAAVALYLILRPKHLPGEPDSYPTTPTPKFAPTAAHAPAPAYTGTIAAPTVLQRVARAQSITGPRQTLSFRPSQFLGPAASAPGSDSSDSLLARAREAASAVAAPGSSSSASFSLSDASADLSASFSGDARRVRRALARSILDR